MMLNGQKRRLRGRRWQRWNGEYGKIASSGADAETLKVAGGDGRGLQRSDRKLLPKSPAPATDAGRVRSWLGVCGGAAAHSSGGSAGSQAAAVRGIQAQAVEGSQVSVG